MASTRSNVCCVTGCPKFTFRSSDIELYPCPSASDKEYRDWCLKIGKSLNLNSTICSEHFNSNEFATLSREINQKHKF